MRWYINDASLDGQFEGDDAFVSILTQLLAARNGNARLRAGLRTVRGLPDRQVRVGVSLRQFVQRFLDRDTRGITLSWLDRSGPFLEDDRMDEPDDYFECFGLDVTESGLGEAARRVKSADKATSFSFIGSKFDFARSPVIVYHGLADDRLGRYEIDNTWTAEALILSAAAAIPPVTSWRGLVDSANERFVRLRMPESLYQDETLAREPFSEVIAERALVLLDCLNNYMLGRNLDGSESVRSKEIIDRHFTGARALFTGESYSNQREFSAELTFPDPDDKKQSLFAHWHGKISHRYYRVHFEWPVPAGQEKLKIVYLGPKITKT